MNIAETVIDYIATQLTADTLEVTIDSNLTQDLRLDSTAMMELVLWVGDTFDITIQNEDLTPENFATPARIVAFVESHKGAVGG